MRLGDLDEALRMIVDSREDNPYTGDEAVAWRVAHDCAITCVTACPTIDAVPVVRCKDCDKSEPSNVWDGWVFCKSNAIHHRDDNFCSYGERKDGEG